MRQKVFVIGSTHVVLDDAVVANKSVVEFEGVKYSLIFEITCKKAMELIDDVEGIAGKFKIFEAYRTEDYTIQKRVYHILKEHHLEEK